MHAVKSDSLDPLVQQAPKLPLPALSLLKKLPFSKAYFCFQTTDSVLKSVRYQSSSVLKIQHLSTLSLTTVFDCQLFSAQDMDPEM